MLDIPTIAEVAATVAKETYGDKNVIDEMLKSGYNFGGEESGHLIFRDYSTTGDGLVAALQVLRILKARGESLSKLKRCWTRFPKQVTNIKVRDKKPFEQLDGVLALVKEAEAEVQPSGGRVLLRYSGTEPKARLLIEGKDMVILDKWSQTIATAIKRQIGA
mgnify:CR=1 FL=1